MLPFGFNTLCEFRVKFSLDDLRMVPGEGAVRRGEGGGERCCTVHSLKQSGSISVSSQEPETNYYPYRGTPGVGLPQHVVL